MNIAADRVNFTKYLCNKSRTLDSKSKAVVLLTCGFLTYKWAKFTYPNESENDRQVMTLKESSCALYDKFEMKHEQNAPDLLTKGEKAETSSREVWSHYFPFFRSQQSSEKEGHTAALVQQDEIPRNVVIRHLQKFGLELSTIESAIDEVQKQNKPLQISPILNELLKQNNGVLHIESSTADYDITAHSTSVNAYERTEYDYYILQTDLEAKVTKGPYRVREIASPARTMSVFAMGLSSMAAMSVYNALAPKFLSSLNKVSLCKSHAIRIAYGCTLSFLFAYPALYGINYEYRQKLHPERNPCFSNYYKEDKMYVRSYSSGDTPAPKESDGKPEIATQLFVGTSMFAMCGYIAGALLGGFMFL